MLILQENMIEIKIDKKMILKQNFKGFNSHQKNFYVCHFQVEKHLFFFSLNNYFTCSSLKKAEQH